MYIILYYPILSLQHWQWRLVYWNWTFSYIVVTTLTVTVNSTQFQVILLKFLLYYRNNSISGWSRHWVVFVWWRGKVSNVLDAVGKFVRWKRNIADNYRSSLTTNDKRRTFVPTVNSMCQIMTSNNTPKSIPLIPYLIMASSENDKYFIG